MGTGTWDLPPIPPRIIRPPAACLDMAWQGRDAGVVWCGVVDVGVGVGVGRRMVQVQVQLYIGHVV